MDRCKVGFYLAAHGLPPTVFSKQYKDLPPTFFAEAAHESHPADRRGVMADCSSTAGIHLIVAKSFLAKNAGSPLRPYAFT